MKPGSTDDDDDNVAPGTMQPRPELLTNSADWVLRYGKGRAHNAGDRLVLPSQKVTITRISVDMYASYDQVESAINDALDRVGLVAISMNIRKGRVLLMETIAAVVYFISAYHARCAVPALRQLGRVHLGQSVATTRVS